MRMIKFLSAVSLIASAPCVLSGQNPAPSPPPPAPAPRRGAMPPERRMEVKRMVMARGGMGAMAMAGGMHQMMMMDAASMFLAHTGELQLTDAQVTRLAAIARRSEARQKAMHARMDSAMAHAWPDGGARRWSAWRDDDDDANADADGGRAEGTTRGRPRGVLGADARSTGDGVGVDERAPHAVARVRALPRHATAWRWASRPSAPSPLR